VNPQVPTLPAASLLEHVTGVEPTPKRLPEGGVQLSAIAPQLSVTDVAKVTIASQRLLSQFTTRLLEHVTTGLCESITLTLKVHRLVLPAPSSAVHCTRVVPTAKMDPEGGLQTTAEPLQLSEAEGAKSTRASHRPLLAATMIFVGQSRFGGSVSRTVTLNVQPVSFPLASRARHCTSVVPLMKSDPLGGVQTRFVMPSHASSPETLNNTGAVH
jgi:hypothetical protein